MSPGMSALPVSQKPAVQEFSEPEGVSVFNQMLVIPPDSISARLYSHTEIQDLSPMQESIPQFEIQDTSFKRPAGKHKIPKGRHR